MILSDAPVCGEASPQVVGAAIDEALRVRCSVQADPADVTFLWQFNNSGESFNVSPARYGKNFIVLLEKAYSLKLICFS